MPIGNDGCYEGNRHDDNLKRFMECMDISTPLPTKWEICDCCQGNGTHALRGFVIDPSEWESEEMDDYMNGAYDTACGECNGTGKLKVVEWENVDPEIRKEWEDWETSRLETDQISYMERMMGA